MSGSWYEMPHLAPGPRADPERMMSPSGHDESGVPDAEQERIPFFQRLLDNPFLLLFLGVTIPAVLYIVWGIMEIIQIPIAPS